MTFPSTRTLWDAGIGVLRELLTSHLHKAVEQHERKGATPSSSHQQEERVADSHALPRREPPTYWLPRPGSAEPVPSDRVSRASVCRPRPVRFRPSGRVSLPSRSDNPAVRNHKVEPSHRPAGRRRGSLRGARAPRARRRGAATGGEVGGPLNAVVTCRAKSSSVAWASLTPSSRSGQATSDASCRPCRLLPG